MTDAAMFIYAAFALVVSALCGLLIHVAIVTAYRRGAQAAIDRISDATFNLDILIHNQRAIMEFRSVATKKPKQKVKNAK